MSERDTNVTVICAGNSFLITDGESGSKGVMPIIVDNGYMVKIVKVDKGILSNERESERACDYIMIAKDKFDKIVCMTELKGTYNGNEISHAYNQISQSIDRIPVEYFNNAQYVMAAVAGAQDKTLPSMINQEKRKLCQKMRLKCMAKVKDMNKLVFYVQPSKGIKKAYVNNKKNPCVIECHSKHGAEIPVPSMLVEAIEG